MAAYIGEFIGGGDAAFRDAGGRFARHAGLAFQAWRAGNVLLNNAALIDSSVLFGATNVGIIAKDYVSSAEKTIKIQKAIERIPYRITGKSTGDSRRATQMATGSMRRRRTTGMRRTTGRVFSRRRGGYKSGYRKPRYGRRRTYRRRYKRY